MDINFLRGVATIVVMASFLSICWWAYIYRSKESFSDAARLPFIEEPSFTDDEASFENSPANINEPSKGAHQ